MILGRIFKLGAFAFLFSLIVFVALWWFNLPYHDFPVEYESRKIALSSHEDIPQPTLIDVPYAHKSRFQKLDLFIPASVIKPYPLVIWIHGGGLIMGDKSSMPRTDFGTTPTPTSNWGPYQIQVPDVRKLNADGYAVASVNYRLGVSPVIAAKSAIKDVKAAVRFLRANSSKYNVDPERFAVWGNSMGGYLAAMLAITGNRESIFDDASLADLNISSEVQAAIVWFGAEDRMPNELNLHNQIDKSKDIPPFLIASTLNVSIAQRLVRKLCVHCKEEDGKFYKAKGCAKCNFTGYDGRVAVGELFLVDDDVKMMLKNNMITIKKLALNIKLLL